MFVLLISKPKVCVNVKGVEPVRDNFTLGARNAPALIPKLKTPGMLTTGHTGVAQSGSNLSV